MMILDLFSEVGNGQCWESSRKTNSLATLLYQRPVV